MDIFLNQSVGIAFVLSTVPGWASLVVKVAVIKPTGLPVWRVFVACFIECAFVFAVLVVNSESVLLAAVLLLFLSTPLSFWLFKRGQADNSQAVRKSWMLERHLVVVIAYPVLLGLTYAILFACFFRI